MNDDFFDRSLTQPPGSAPHGASAPTELPPETSDPSDASASAGSAASIPSAGPSSPDAPSTPAALKSAVQELLRCGLVEREAKPNLYRSLATGAATGAVSRILEPLDLALTVDDVRGLAFLVVPALAAETAEQAWQHPLVRRQRLTTEQSLLVAILRQAHIAHEQQYGIGAPGAHADCDDLLAQFNLYLGDSGSEARNLDRLLRVLGQLQVHGIVSEPDKDQRVFIRPVIVHLANPEHLQLLLHHFKTTAALAPKNADASPVADDAPSSDDSRDPDPPAASPAPPLG